MAGAALLALGGAAAAHSVMAAEVSPPATPSPPAPPEPPTVDTAEIEREVAESMAEARRDLAEARKDIAEARAEVMGETYMPASARQSALAALDKAERDLERAVPLAAD